MKHLLLRADKRALSMFNGISKKVSVARRLDGRINNLWLFATPEKAGSQPEHADHPDVQVLLRMRDRLYNIESEIKVASAMLASAQLSDKERSRALEALSRLRAEEIKGIDQLSDKLDTLRSESTRHWTLVAKMLADLAKLRQTDSHFQKKLQIANDKDAGLSVEERAFLESRKPKESDDDDA